MIFRILTWGYRKGIGKEFTGNIKNKNIGHPPVSKLGSRFRVIHFSLYYHYS